MTIDNQRITVEISLADIKDSVMRIIQTESEAQSAEPLNKKQAAQVLGISVPTLDRLVQKSDIPFRKMGDGKSARVIFLKGEVISWLKNRKRNGKSI